VTTGICAYQLTPSAEILQRLCDNLHPIAEHAAQSSSLSSNMVDRKKTDAIQPILAGRCPSRARVIRMVWQVVHMASYP
jgi:hypothetical protein